jgi:transcriptional regulator of arginine metabolism
MKKNRHEKIIEIVEKYDVETQDELIERLRQSGYDVTQATVSRDIRALKLVKVLTENGSYRYVLPRIEDGAENVGEGSAYRKAYVQSITEINYAMNNVVVKTTPGMASAVALLLDQTYHSLMLGSVAGDDTILVVTRNEEDARLLASNIQIEGK